MSDQAAEPITLADFQRMIDEMYSDKDRERGIDATFMWLVEEIGELASSLREETLEEQRGEFADVLAWLTTIANVAGVDLTLAIREKYGDGCPGCQKMVCDCEGEKP